MGIVKAKGSSGLSEELVTARQKYERTRESVLDRAQQRQEAIASTIGDLEVESDDLQGVIDEARR